MVRAEGQGRSGRSTTERVGRCMSTPERTAPLDPGPAGLAETLKPVERASMLPPRAFIDPGVLGWELENMFARLGLRRATSPPSASRAAT